MNKCIDTDCQPQPGGKAKWWARLRLPTLLLLVFLVYAPSLQYDFAWDDWGLIVGNPDIQSPRWTHFVFRSFWQRGTNVADTTRAFYRPLITLSYAIDYAVWGLNPTGFHLTNILAHLIAVWLAYRLARLLHQPPAAAWLLALIFAIHPLRVENVVWIAGRTDVFAGLFYLGATAALLQWQRGQPPKSRGWLSACLLCYALALFSKEMALTWPLIAMLLLWMEGLKPRKMLLPFILPTALISSVYLLMRLFALGTLGKAHSTPGMLTRIINIPVVFMNYAGLLLHINQPAPHHAAEYLTLSAPTVWVSALLMACAAAGVLALAIRRSPYAFHAAWFMLTLLPLYYLGAFGDILYADRFLYIPSFGFYLLLATCLRNIFNKAVPSLRLCFLYLIPAGYAATAIFINVAYASIWRDDARLFRHAARISDQSAYIWFNFGHALERAGQLSESYYAYQRTLKIEPDYREALTNLGRLHLKAGDYEQALLYFLHALRAGDHSNILYENLGRLYRETGRYSAAIEAYLRAVVINPTAAGYNNLGECFLAINEPRRAYYYFAQALEKEISAAIYINMARAALEQNRPDTALRNLERAKSLLSTAPPFHRLQYLINMGEGLEAKGKTQAAQEARHKALNKLTLITDIDPATKAEIIKKLEQAMQLPRLNGNAAEHGVISAQSNYDN